jgi:hypothetical protein
MLLSFLSRGLTLRLPGLKEGKKTPREGFLTLPRIQICRTASSLKKSR